jgi:glycosyltransferase involved in cell wall biosynthesis
MKLFFDVSTVAHRVGTPGGISRVEREFANHAFKFRPDIQFSFYDSAMGGFRLAKRERIPDLIGTEYLLDTSRLESRASRMLNRLPPPLRSTAYWLRRFRYNLQIVLERLRLTTSHSAVRICAERLVKLVRNLSPTHGKGRPKPPILPFDLAIGDEIPLDTDCVLVSVGGDYRFKDIDRIAEIKAHYRFRYVLLCHDLIMIQFPQLAGEIATEHVRKYWNKAFPVADMVIFTTATVEEDVRSFCRANNLALRKTAIVPLGWNPAEFSKRIPAILPEGIEPGRYILFVSSLEARKGHEMIMAVWRRLLDDGIPQATGMKLVFIGEHVFNTPRLKQRLLSGELGPTLVHFEGVMDSQLAKFYRCAAFCLFPSQYEGFGLPVIEALGAGKPIIVSTGGAVPEIAAGLAPCLDTNDQDSWYAEIKLWLEDPAIREEYAHKISDQFDWPTWDECGENFFKVIKKTIVNTTHDN